VLDGRAKRRAPNLLGQQKSHFWMAFEAAHCAIMLAALVLLFVYVVQLGAAGSVQVSIDVYDGDATAPAHYLMTRRDSSNEAAAAWQQKHGAAYLCTEPCRDHSVAEGMLGAGQGGQVVFRSSATGFNDTTAAGGVTTSGPDSVLCNKCLEDAVARLARAAAGSAVDAIPVPNPGEGYRWQLPEAQPNGFEEVVSRDAVLLEDTSPGTVHHPWRLACTSCVITAGTFIEIAVAPVACFQSRVMATTPCDCERF
jgi:hypothetical protein